ncbi:hypothetical protein SCYAM73S_05916 [Streptomyces cyaneofuscatus]
MATTSPRSRAAARSVAIIRLSSPRRRCVGATVTPLIASAGTVAPPTTVSRWANERNVATHRPASNAPWRRERSVSASRSATSSSLGEPAVRKPFCTARSQSG